MKKLTLLLVFIVIAHLLQAEIVPIETAKKVALHFYTKKINEQKANINPKDIYLKDSYSIIENTAPIFYIFNISDYGYICISAEDRTFPVLAYSFESSYNPQNIIAPFQMWMDEYKNQILQARKNNIVASIQVIKAWQILTENKFEKTALKSVQPFVKSKWDQGKKYNTRCPEDPAGPGGRCVTGCVATCLGQIMYYYRFPNQGLGSFSYTHPVYGNLFADYSNTTYDWDAMCDLPNKPNAAIGKIISHSGIGVSMNYGPSSSGMTNHSADYVLRTYFKYPQNVQYVYRDSTNVRWDSLMIAQLDKKMPLYYAGWSIPDIDGHAFVCDGYQDTTFFHFNFGWGGSYDGYFSINALSPGGSNFNLAQELIINIYPDTSLYSYPDYCTGIKTLTALEGSLEDGSGPLANYQTNSNCSWLIAPNTDSVNSIIFDFNELKTQIGHGIIKIYNGNTTSAPLIGSYSGNTIPGSITVNKSQVLISFSTDNDTIKAGFFINYKTNTPNFCSNIKMLNAPSGIIVDGSGSKRYNANTSCKWVISPGTSTANISIHFNNIDTESNRDKITVKGSSVTALATFSGNTIPQGLTITGKQAELEWITDFENELQGWEISYTSSNVGINTIESIQNMIIFPNPAKDILNISMDINETQNIICEVFSMEGKLVYSEKWNKLTGISEKQININNFESGIYMLKLTNQKNEVSKQKIVIK